MISTSITAMAIFDLVIIGMIILMLFVSIYLGVFKKGAVPLRGRGLILLGVIITGLFYLTDLLVMTMYPAEMSQQRLMEIVAFMHLDLRWIVTLLSMSLITSGFIAAAFQRRKVEDMISRNDSLIASAGERIAESEGRFNSVMERSADAVYCFEARPPIPINLPIEDQVVRCFDAELVICNKLFANAVGKDSREEAIGLRFRDLRSMSSSDSFVKFFRDLAENNFLLDNYEYEFADSKGNKNVLLISATGDIENDALVRLWGSERNILEQTEVRETLIGRLMFQEFVTRISSRLLLTQFDNIEHELAGCMKDICGHLKADRMTIAWIDRDELTAEPLYFWNETGHRTWEKLSLSEFPFVGPQLVAGIPVIIDSVEDMANEYEEDARRLAASGVSAVIVTPTFIAGEMTCICSLGVDDNSRHWTSYDISDLQYFSDLIANVVFRINARKELDQALIEVESMKDRLEAENVYLRQEISSEHGFEELVGESEALRHCLHQVQQVAGTDTTVLVQGDTGTGKELVVRAIHNLSARSDRPLVKVNCAALPSELIESELFGHEKGAFTGAATQKRGRFDLADGGTLFLDEIGDFPYELQGKLLRVLQEGEFQRVGGTETLNVDVRLVAATNRNLPKAVDCGKFRADLFYRISVYPINLPSLCDRQGDVELLAEHFIHKHSAGLGKKIDAISAAMMDKLLAYSWPGNIRELESVIQRALISASGPVLQLTEDLGVEFGRGSTEWSTNEVLSVDLIDVEKAHIERVLDQAGWVIAGGTGAAVKLGVPPSTLRSKMKKLGIHRPY